MQYHEATDGNVVDATNDVKGEVMSTLNIANTIALAFGVLTEGALWNGAAWQFITWLLG